MHRTTLLRMGAWTMALSAVAWLGARPAEASKEGRRNTAAVLGAVGAYELLRGNTGTGVVAAAGAAVAYKRYRDADERDDRYYRDRYRDRNRTYRDDRYRNDRTRDPYYRTRTDDRRYDDRYDRNRRDRERQYRYDDRDLRAPWDGKGSGDWYDGSPYQQGGRYRDERARDGRYQQGGYYQGGQQQGGRYPQDGSYHQGGYHQQDGYYPQSGQQQGGYGKGSKSRRK